MTYYEIFYFIGLVCIPLVFTILGILLKDEALCVLGVFSLVVIISVGCITSIVYETKTPYITTSEFETEPKMVTLTDQALVVIADDNEVIQFTDYRYINAWKEGGKFFKKYQYKKVTFGSDSQKYEFLVKKLEK